jgi:hypothetical protein
MAAKVRRTEIVNGVPIVFVRYWTGIPYASTIRENWRGVTKVEEVSTTTWQGTWWEYRYYGVLGLGEPETVYFTLTGGGWNIRLYPEYQMGCAIGDTRIDCATSEGGFCCISGQVIQNACEVLTKSKEMYP